MPTANVTITPTGEGLTISPPTLLFEPGNWSTKQPVTVTTLQDDDLAANEISITHASTSTDPNYVIAEAGTVVVTVTDDDTADVSVEPYENNAKRRKHDRFELLRGAGFQTFGRGHGDDYGAIRFGFDDRNGSQHG